MANIGIEKTVASAHDIVLKNGILGIIVTFTDKSFVIWSVEDRHHAKEIKALALAGETICVSLEIEDLPDYWQSVLTH